MATVRYREEQRFRQAWIWALVILCAGASWAAAVGLLRSEAADTTWWIAGPVWILCGLVIPVLFAVLRLVLVVDDDSVLIDYRPLRLRRIALDDIASAEAVTYRPIREYGGWGIRGIGAKRAYNVSGDRGVQLVLTDGRRVLLGSQEPEPLAAAIALARQRRP